MTYNYDISTLVEKKEFLTLQIESRLFNLFVDTTPLRE